MFVKCAVLAVLIYAVRGFFTSGAVRTGQSISAAQQELGGICTFLRFSTFQEERETSPGEAFHALRSRSWESSVVVSPGTPRADVWGGHGTGARSLGAGWRAVERIFVSLLF